MLEAKRLNGAAEASLYRNGTSLEATILTAREALKRLQAKDGHWVFELEADATIPAEYIMLEHYLDEIDGDVQTKIAAYLRGIQGEHGGWPLFHDGEVNLSASVKAYYALKLAGDDPDALHMKRAREAILEHGGAAHSNVFTRITLALFRQVPWRAVPVMPVEIMLLPRWFPFHLSKVSYWSRIVLVPLLLLMAMRPGARNPRNVGIGELFVTPPFKERHYLINPTGSALGAGFLILDRLLLAVQRFFPRSWRRRAIDNAVTFITERLNGENGLGGIFPAMANAVMALDALGYSKEHSYSVKARAALRRLLVMTQDSGFCQPCLSPVWDTALTMHALLEAGETTDAPAIQKAARWLMDRQILNASGDWQAQRPNLKPGGWPFQFGNDYYPDTDDSSAALMALHRASEDQGNTSIRRGVDWILGMQNRNGGWGAYDADNTFYYLNHIPFADHGALLDPPTADVTARCVGMLVQCGIAKDRPSVTRSLDYLRREQQADGSWYGRWGTNYVYGTWSVLCAFAAAGEDMQVPHVRKAVDWLQSRQRLDGGWGEDCATYWPERRAEVKESTPTQTAWALLGLMAAGEVHGEAVKRGVEFLLRSPRSGANWHEAYFNAVGFPRVFYLKYHGYSMYFPLWALVRYRNLLRGDTAAIPYGM